LRNRPIRNCALYAEFETSRCARANVTVLAGFNALRRVLYGCDNVVGMITDRPQVDAAPLGYERVEAFNVASYRESMR
jgi:hypothetical protein